MPKFIGTDYAQACTNYLTEALNNQQPKEELDAAQRTLSNPMDLTVVALMLSQGKHPNLFRLQEQQYNLMAAEYLQRMESRISVKKILSRRLSNATRMTNKLYPPRNFTKCCSLWKMRNTRW